MTGMMKAAGVLYPVMLEHYGQGEFITTLLQFTQIISWCTAGEIYAHILLVLLILMIFQM